jgi:dTDP-glucose 4,6-dehydratase
MSKKFLILGSNSCAGNHFLKFCIEKKYKIISTSRNKLNKALYLANDICNEVNHIQIDLNKEADLYKLKSIIENEKPEYIVNFSSQSMVAESWLYPQDWLTTNILSFEKLLQILIKFKFIKKYIHFSTPEVYGDAKGEIIEGSPHNPSTPYALSRSTGDMLLKMYSNQYGLKYAITRAGNVYGKGQKLYRIIPKSFYCLDHDMKIPLHGGGNTRRNFVHSYDVAKALDIIADTSGDFNEFHIGADNYLSIKDLVEKICLLNNKEIQNCTTITEDRKGKDLDYFMSFDKIKQLGWKAEINIEDGLIEIKNWYSEYKKEFELSAINYIHEK